MTFLDMNRFCWILIAEKEVDFECEKLVKFTLIENLTLLCCLMLHPKQHLCVPQMFQPNLQYHHDATSVFHLKRNIEKLIYIKIIENHTLSPQIPRSWFKEKFLIYRRIAPSHVTFYVIVVTQFQIAADLSLSVIFHFMHVLLFCFFSINL